MRCSRAKKIISDYVDKNLESKKILSLERHLGTCPNCKRILKDFQEIAGGAKELKELSPSEQTWLKIKDKLKTEDQWILTFQPRKRIWANRVFYSPGFKYALSSALLLAFIFSAVTLGVRYWSRRELLGREARQRYTLAKLDEAEHHYQLAIKALGEALSAQEGYMDPQVAEVFKTNLEIIDSSIMACRQTVLQDPDNLEARNYLLTAYRGKVDFLNGMIEIKKTSSQKKEREKTI